MWKVSEDTDRKAESKMRSTRQDEGHSTVKPSREFGSLQTQGNTPAIEATSSCGSNGFPTASDWPFNPINRVQSGEQDAHQLSRQQRDAS
mmetsp:Transcript_10089/g.21986  ORF Transcript_10089/g.21986 Transcript_10089/m.21986 type:complete len:90 (-) Transcript_10089:145-414(-)